MARRVFASMRLARDLRAPKARTQWGKVLSNWPPRLQRAARLPRTRLLRQLSSWRRIAPVSSTAQNSLWTEGAPRYEDRAPAGFSPPRLMGAGQAGPSGEDSGVVLTATLPVVMLCRGRASTFGTRPDQHRTCRCIHPYQKVEEARYEQHCFSPR